MSKPIGKTIQIFLPDGNPRGVKIAEFTSRTVQVVLVPRAQLDFACSRPELKAVGLYFLFGDSQDGNLPSLYIGEAEDCVDRLKQQNKSKEWNTALVCVSKSADFTKAHVKYLEWFCYEAATIATRYKLAQTVPTKSYLPEPAIADLMDHFDTIRILSSSLGFPLFDPIPKSATSEVLACKGKHAAAKGEYTEEGMVVFAGSTANRTDASSITGNVVALRKQLVESGVLAVQDESTFKFTKDYIFSSPSAAAAVILARSSNGWVEWKYPDGRTLDKVKRGLGD